MPRRKAFEPLQLKLYPCQREVFASKARFRVLVAGRRFGKTHLALSELVYAAQKPGSVNWYVGPNDGQSEWIAWEALKAMTRRFWARKPDKRRMRIDLCWGSIIRVAGAYRPDSLRGGGIDFLVMDEYATIKPEAWGQVLRASLADREGRVLFIGTPKGRNHFYELAEYGRTDADWEVFQFTTAQGGVVNLNEVESAARGLDAATFRQEFGGEFTSIGQSAVYYAFDPENNVCPVHFEPGAPLVWAIDFNVNPMCMLFMQKFDQVVHVIDEIVIRPNANTEMACQEFEKRARLLTQRLSYLQTPLRVELYGDAAGNQRRTAGTATDWQIVKDFFKMWVGTYQPSYRVPSVNPLVRDRVNCVNSRLRNQLGEARVFIDPRCRELIKDLEQVTWAVDAKGTTTSEIDKTDGMRTHTSDALGYFIAQVFPMKAKVGEQSGRLVFH